MSHHWFLEKFFNPSIKDQKQHLIEEGIVFRKNVVHLRSQIKQSVEQKMHTVSVAKNLLGRVAEIAQVVYGFGGKPSQGKIKHFLAATAALFVQKPLRKPFVVSAMVTVGVLLSRYFRRKK